MPFTRPTLAALTTRIVGDLRGRLEVTGTMLRRAMVDVLGLVWAGGIHELYGYLDWLARQLFATTAERDALLRMAAPYGIVPAPAQFAVGPVTATGTDGTPILDGTVLRFDAVTAYLVTGGGATITAGTATLSVRAALAGAAANLAAGTALTFETSIPGVASAAVVATGGIIGGDDGDAGDAGTERIRSRYLLRLREPPAGGAEQDYIAWTLAAVGAGATRVWVYPNELGLGTVVVRFVNDNAVPIFPDAPAVAAAQAALDAQRPITAVVTAVAPTDLPVAFTIHLVPDTADTRTAVSAELADMMRRLSEPGDGAVQGTILVSKVRTAIDIAAGVEDYVLTVPAADVVPAPGQLPTVGVITWV